MQINILITSSGNVNGKRLLKSAQENSNINSLKVYGTDVKKNNIKNIFHVPSVNNTRYFEKISKIINKYKIKKGELLTIKNLCFKRTSKKIKAMEPKEFFLINKRKSKFNLDRGIILKKSHYSI